MARAVALVVRVEVIDVTTGLWCRACLVPSGQAITAAVHIGHMLRLATERRCNNCHGRDIEA